MSASPAANNIGFRQTQSELVLLLNSDTIVAAGAIDRLIRVMRELPGALWWARAWSMGAGRRSFPSDG